LPGVLRGRRLKRRPVPPTPAAEQVADVWSYEGVIFAMIDDVPCRPEIG